MCVAMLQCSIVGLTERRKMSQSWTRWTLETERVEYKLNTANKNTAERGHPVNYNLLTRYQLQYSTGEYCTHSIVYSEYTILIPLKIRWYPTQTVQSQNSTVSLSCGILLPPRARSNSKSQTEKLFFVTLFSILFLFRSLEDRRIIIKQQYCLLNSINHEVSRYVVA